MLPDNTKIAVKRLTDYESPGGEAAFLREVEMISVAVHKNLLRLIGFCTTPTERLLVYPFMQNLSVAYRLRGTNPFQLLLTLKCPLTCIRTWTYCYILTWKMDDQSYNENYAMYVNFNVCLPLCVLRIGTCSYQFNVLPSLLHLYLYRINAVENKLFFNFIN